MAVSSPNTEDLTRTENLVELVQLNFDLTKPSSTLTTSKTDQALEVILSKVTELAQGQSSLESRLTKSQSDLMQGTATILNEMSQRIESLEQSSRYSSRRTNKHTNRDTSREASPTTDPGLGTITSKVTEKPVAPSHCHLSSFHHLQNIFLALLCLLTLLNPHSMSLDEVRDC